MGVHGIIIFHSLCSLPVPLSLLPSVHYRPLRTKILQFNRDMELYMEVFGENVNCDGNGFLALSFICPSLTLLSSL